MAKAKFHSLRGETSALILVKPNLFVFSAEPVYVPREALPQVILDNLDGSVLKKDKEEIASFDIPDGFDLVPFTAPNPDTGEIETRTTKEGEILKVLHY